MKHVIIGTAGHIDHGKTTLIKALTGRDTDNLQEEKQRGISINLGFTFFDLPSNKRAGIIDVPGHEKFIKNMLAGATSLDVVLLTIALDEGIMPQTKEHIDILEILNVKKAIIVLTKRDLVDDEWNDMIKDEIKKYLEKTSFKNSPIIEVSAKTKKGINELINEIDKSVNEVESKDCEGFFRLSVDRSFSLKGFGTIVTGTVLSGTITVGDNIILEPKGLEGKIRNIQIHEENVTKGEAGQRCALNLVGLKKEDIKRGDVICASNTITPSYMFDIKFKYLKSNEKFFVNRQRVKIYHGTSEIIGRAIILDKDEVKPGEEALVQLRLEKQICSQKGDYVVIRNFSPVITLGGGRILEPNSKKVKPFNDDYINNLKLRENGTLEDIVENSVLQASEVFPKATDILKTIGTNIDNIQEVLEQLVYKKKIMKLIVGNDYYYIHNKFFNNKSQEIYYLIDEYHKNNPLKVGIKKEEIKSKLFSKKVKQRLFQEFICLMENRKIIKQGSITISLNSFSIRLTREQQRIKNLIIDSFKVGELHPQKFQDIIKYEKDKKICENILEMIIEEKILVRIYEDIIIESNILENAQKEIIEFIKDNGSINLGEAKEILNTSRKFLVAIMEYLDENKITKRIDDNRVLN